LWYFRISDPKAQVLEDVVISNAKHNEPLKSGSFFKNTDTERRMIFTDRNMHTTGILQPKGKTIFPENKVKYLFVKYFLCTFQICNNAEFFKPILSLQHM
jgi:hypothetical protein